MDATNTSMLTPQRIAAIARPIARRYGIGELYLFGSLAQGTATGQSDVDFIYDIAGNRNQHRALHGFRNDLREALGRSIDLTRKDYVITSIDDNPLAELQRRAFVDNLNKHTIYRIV